MRSAMLWVVLSCACLFGAVPDGANGDPPLVAGKDAQMETIGYEDLLQELVSGGADGLSAEEIGALVKSVASGGGMRGQRRISTAGMQSEGRARNLDVPFSRAAALAAAASTTMTATPTRDSVIGRLYFFSTAHDDVSLTSLSIAGREQNIGAASAPCPLVRFYRDAIDTLPSSYDVVPATQSIVATVKNEHAATATNIMGTAVVESVA